MASSATTDKKRFLIDNQQTSPIPLAVYSSLQKDLDSLRSNDVDQKQEMARLGGTIADLNTHLSRTDATVNDLLMNRTTCPCSNGIHTGSIGLPTGELQNISQKLETISVDVHNQALVTSNLSAITGSVSRQMSGTYQLLEELISLPAAQELKHALQNSDLHTIFGNITSAHTQSQTCSCNMSDISSRITALDQKYRTSLLHIDNMKSHASAIDNKLSQSDATIQSFQQKLDEQVQNLNTKNDILSDMNSQIHKLTLDLNKQSAVIQNLTSEKASQTTAASSLEDKVQTQAATIQAMSNTLSQQNLFINNLVNWLKDTVQLPCTTGSIHNLCPTGTNEVVFRNHFHEAPSISVSASLLYTPTKAVLNHVAPTVTNVTPQGFRISVTCESNSNYAIEATWKACVIPLAGTNTK
ncbi:hypothetical protein KP79_PYT03972 [Mizuhopecten yessoensis]|uniref:H-type lectin domain-containing protein n=2 Tax=Mizuhopecten yessoensis TaxID=6573 RepID=A0A210PSX5_MIZYE|nr:hypothetical protein KP79_PYT03972 [Mizuhopecten yessoensis]